MFRAGCGKFVLATVDFWLHAARHPEINVNLLTEAIYKVSLPETANVYGAYVDMEYVIGNFALVYHGKRTRQSAEINFGLRKGRLCPTPIAVEHNGTPTTVIFLYFKKLIQNGICGMHIVVMDRVLLTQVQNQFPKATDFAITQMKQRGNKQCMSD